MAAPQAVIAPAAGELPGGRAAHPATSRSAVAMLRWPEDRDEVEALRMAHVPRLLFVAPGDAAPAAMSPEEDWVRTPASAEDVGARVAGIIARAASLSALVVRPYVTNGRLVRGDDWVALSPIESHLAEMLVGSFGDVVALDLLTFGPNGHVLSPNAVRVHVMRLRRRLRPFGLSIRSVHARGYLMEGVRELEA